VDTGSNYTCTCNGYYSGTDCGIDINECATDNGGCGDAAYYICTNNAGAVPTCADIDECATDNGGCGDAAYYICTNNAGAVPTCADIDECATDNGGCGDATCVNNEGTAPTCDGEPLSLYNGLVPGDYELKSVYPNPFNPVANIIYGMPENAHLRIMVFDIQGRQVATLVEGFQFAGYHQVNWDARLQPSGMYLVKFMSETFTTTQKVVLMK
jgi:hypothetical protein